MAQDAYDNQMALLSQNVIILLYNALHTTQPRNTTTQDTTYLEDG